jgi:hypothetical protein
MIDHPSLRVVKDTGIEGPRHDPYSWQSYTVTTPRGVTRLRTGIGVSVTHDGKDVDPPKNLRWTEAESYLITKVFPELCGYTLKQLERIYVRRMARCKCGCKDTKEVDGYPGETITVCCQCGTVRDTSFNINAVM